MPAGIPTIAQLWEGDVSFFSIDTNLIQAAAYNFEVGALNKLPKILPSTMHLRFTEVVVEEVIGHLMEPIVVAINQFKTASEKLNRSAATEMAPIDKIFTGLSVDENARRNFHKKIIDYVERCRGGILKLDGANIIGKMFKLYFNAEAPFALRKDKKYEFPDAAALLLLEEYAEKSNTIGILASDDVGWKHFAEMSEHFYCVGSIDELTALFEATSDHGEKVKKKILDAINDDSSVLRLALNDELKEHIANSTWSVDDIYGSGAERVEAEAWGANLESYILDPKITKAWVVEGDPTAWVVELTAIVQADVDIGFQFFVWDSIDKEEIAMTSDSTSRSCEVEVKVFLTCSSVQDGTEPDDWDIDVEIATSNYSLDVGEVEMDLSDGWH